MVYQGYEDYFEKPVIISVAPTGGMHGKEANPNLPEQPQEIVEDVKACREAGAAIVHVHAREGDGAATHDPARFQEVVDLIRAECPDMLINFTTGGSDLGEHRLQPVLEVDPSPDLATVDLGPLNVSGNSISENTRVQNEEYAEAMGAHDVKPELEVFGPGHLTESHHLVERDLVDPPYWHTLILGMQTGTVPHPRNLQNLVDNLPAQSEWQAMAIGQHQLPLTTMGVILGGHVRVGMEDNVYYRYGELAESNAQFVERAADIAERLERPVATPEDARELLGL